MKSQVNLSLILCLILASVLALNVLNVSAVEPTAKIVPTEGTVYTPIFLQIRGLEKFLEGDNWPGYRDMEMYLYWDDKPLFLGLPDPGSGDKNMHYFDVNLTAPNEHPYSDLRNHTIYIEIYEDWTAYLCNFTLTFEINEYLPCDEYLALNATYYQFLANYTALNASYANLQSEYNALANNYTSLLTDYNNSVAQYGSLSTSYNSLSTSYNSISNSYNALQSIHNSLATACAQLQGNYIQLTSLHDDLQTKNNGLSTDLTNYRNLSYAMIMTTIAFLATTVYLASRKPKMKTA